MYLKIKNLVIGGKSPGTTRGWWRVLPSFSFRFSELSPQQ